MKVNFILSRSGDRIIKSKLFQTGLVGSYPLGHYWEHSNWVFIWCHLGLVYHPLFINLTLLSDNSVYLFNCILLLDILLDLGGNNGMEHIHESSTHAQCTMHLQDCHTGIMYEKQERFYSLSFSKHLALQQFSGLIPPLLGPHTLYHYVDILCFCITTLVTVASGRNRVTHIFMMDGFCKCQLFLPHSLLLD